MMVWRGAWFAGSPSAADCTQEVLCRYLASGRRLDDPAIKHPPAFWGSAGRREAIREWRKRHQFEGRRGQEPNGEEVPFDPALLDFYFGVNQDLEAQVFARIELARVPPKIVRLALKDHLSNAERQALFRWRREARREEVPA